MRGMPFQLAGLELARVAKRRDTYVFRVLVAGTILVALLMLEGTAWQEARHWMLDVAYFLQYGAVYLLAPILAVMAMQREKDENTLDLLILADHTGLDVALAKFIPPFLTTGLLVLSTLPMLAFAAFLGGVDTLEAAADTVEQVCWAAAACGLALWAASVSSSATRGLLLAYGLLEVTRFGVHAISRYFSTPPPSTMARVVFDVGITPQPPWAVPLAFALALGLPLAVAAIGVARTARAIRRGLRERHWRWIPLLGTWRHRRSRVRLLPPHSEAAYVRVFLLRAVGGRHSAWGIALPTLLFVASPLSLLFFVSWSIIISLACAMSILFLDRLHQSGVLDDLYLTALGEDELRNGMIGCLLRRLYPFLLPLGLSLIGPFLLFARLNDDIRVALLWLPIALVFAAVLAWTQLAFAASNALEQASRNASVRNKVAVCVVAFFFFHGVCFLLAVLLLLQAFDSEFGFIITSAVVPLVGASIYRAFSAYTLTLWSLRGCVEALNKRSPE